MTARFAAMTRRFRDSAQTCAVFALCAVASMVLPITLSALSHYAA